MSSRSVVCVDLLNLACCAIEAARGFELWRTQIDEKLNGQLGEQLLDSQLFVIDPKSLDEASVRPDLSVLVVAGTVTHAQAQLVTQRFAALPEPRAVAAFGVCTISGGPYWDSYSVLPGIESLVEVDVMVPGCPPLPEDVAVALDQLVSDRLGMTALVGAHV